MKIQYDPRANAAYIYLVEIAPGGVAHTYPCDPLTVANGIFLDFDAANRLIGIDVSNARTRLPEGVLERAEIMGDQP